ncbi:hypothetical protein SLA2020_360910 [Shorea laevis]
MSGHNLYADREEEDDEELSTSENDDEFLEDLEALKQACLKTGTDPNDIQVAAADCNCPPASAATASAGGGGGPSVCDSDSDDDLELFRSIRNRFALSDDVCEPLSMKPLCTLPPIASDDDDAEDDLQTLRAIQRRFSAYTAAESGRKSKSDCLPGTDKVNQSCMPSEDVSCHDCLHEAVNEADTGERFQKFEEAHSTVDLSNDNLEMPSSSLIQLHQSDPSKASENSTFPKSAQMLIDAIKRNRSCQKFVRSKLAQIETKLDENKKLKERVKILKNLEISCKRRTGRALSMGKDPRVQLISARKSWTTKDLEDNDKSLGKSYGPPQNSQVANYRMALTKFPLSLHPKKWTTEERENLQKGIRQQFQETVLRGSVDWFSGSEGSWRDGSNLDDILASIKDLEITPERIREFLPEVNWDQLALMYAPGHSGAECEARWLNHEDPLINRSPWTAEEDKNLLFIIQEKGIANWQDTAVSLGTNRTPYQCLARYQRSLNAHILNREWTEEEDDKLRLAVEAFGERDWQSVASALTGRTGTQCSNRWKKSLHPSRQRVGRWSADEDKHLKVAVMLFGPKNWKKIAEFVPGRTQVQCRERWVNSLDPSLSRGEWTKEEDLQLEAAIEQHGYCWSKVAACMPSRTDNQCWRRWKALHPDQVPLLQEARRIRKAACITNFVDRESERPALGANDFIPLSIMGSTSKAENTNAPSKSKRKLRGITQHHGKRKNSTPQRLHPVKSRPKRCGKEGQSNSTEVHEKISRNEAEAHGEQHARLQQYGSNSCSKPGLDKRLSLPHSAVLITSHGRDAEPVGSSPTIERKECSKRNPKRHSSRRKFSKLGTEQKSFCSENNSSCIEGEGEGDGGVLGEVDITRKKGVNEPQSRCIKPSPQSSVTVNNEAAENLSSNRNTLKDGNRAPGQECESRNSNDPSGDDDMNLAIFCNKSKKRRCQVTENADTSEADGDNMKLATFFSSKIKKRKHVLKNANLSLSKEVDQISNAEQLLLPMQNGKADTRSDSAIPETITACSSSKDMHTTASDRELEGMDTDDSPQEPVRKVESSHQEGDFEAGNVTLACMRRRLKKKQATILGSGEK